MKSIFQSFVRLVLATTFRTKIASETSELFRTKISYQFSFFVVMPMGFERGWVGVGDYRWYTMWWHEAFGSYNTCNNHYFGVISPRNMHHTLIHMPQSQFQEMRHEIAVYRKPSTERFVTTIYSVREMCNDHVALAWHWHIKKHIEPTKLVVAKWRKIRGIGLWSLSLSLVRQSALPTTKRRFSRIVMHPNGTTIAIARNKMIETTEKNMKQEREREQMRRRK